MELAAAAPDEQRVICANCSNVMSSNEYDSHQQNCSPRHFGGEGGGGEPREKIYKELEDAAAATSDDAGNMSDDTRKSESEGEQSSELEISDGNNSSMHDSDNAAADSVDNQMDDNIWRAIANWCRKTETGGLDGFKYW